MKNDLLKQKFLQVNGVSLDLLDKHPEYIPLVFSFKRYHFLNQKRIDGKKKDRENLKILSTW